MDVLPHMLASSKPGSPAFRIMFALAFQNVGSVKAVFEKVILIFLSIEMLCRSMIMLLMFPFIRVPTLS